MDRLHKVSAGGERASVPMFVMRGFKLNGKGTIGVLSCGCIQLDSKKTFYSTELPNALWERIFLASGHSVSKWLYRIKCL